MATPAINSQTAAPPLPLFRPEALAAQEKEHGEVLRMRPLAVMVFPLMGAAVIAVTLAYLFAGHYTEKARVTGFLPPRRSVATEQAQDRPLQAFFVVPAQWMGAVSQGRTMLVRCPGGPDPERRIAATVLAISPAPAKPAAATYNVTLAVPSDISKLLPQTSSPESSTKLEAEIPLGRKPLIHWLTQRHEP